MFRRGMRRAAVGLLATAAGFGLGGLPARAAERPATAATTANAWAPTEDDTRKVNALIDKWLLGPEKDLEAADVALQMTATPGWFPAIELAVVRPDLTDEARAFLKKFVERQRPRVEAWRRWQEPVRQSNEWNLRTAREAFSQVGRHSPKWDEPARQGLDEFFRPRRDSAKAKAFIDDAISKGCDDPFVLYMSARLHGELDDMADPQLKYDARERYVKAAVAMAASTYPPYRRQAASWYAFQQVHANVMDGLRTGRPPNAESIEQMRQTTSGFMDVWPEVVAEPGIPESRLEEVASDIVTMDMPPGGDRKMFFDAIDAPLQKAMPDKALPHLIRGKFYIRYAWDARGSGWANTVTPDGWKLMHERLLEAQKALEKAWELDPYCWQAADQMLTVALGENWTYQQMDVWFNRAVAVEPAERQIYSDKLYFLEPKWHGSPQAMIKFGRQCRDGRYWGAEIPFVLLTAYDRLLEYLPPGQRELFFQQEPAVWADVQSLYVPYLKANPESAPARSSYCNYACRTAHWDEAAKQFEILGDQAEPSRFGGRAQMEQYRATAKERGKP